MGCMKVRMRSIYFHFSFTCCLLSTTTYINTGKVFFLLSIIIISKYIYTTPSSSHTTTQQQHNKVFYYIHITSANEMPTILHSLLFVNFSLTPKTSPNCNQRRISGEGETIEETSYLIAPR